MNVKIKACISHPQANLSNHVVEILQVEIQQWRYYSPELGLPVRLTSESGISVLPPRWLRLCYRDTDLSAIQVLQGNDKPIQYIQKED